MIEDISSQELTDIVKNGSDEQLAELCSDIRRRILECVSKNGGHLASNLGVVELTVALHRVFDSPSDKIIFDVGHQVYVHKMLTGRWEDMDNLRCMDGISGFPKRKESPHDAFDSGHSGGSISQAYGYAKARDLSGASYSCIAVIGDGALTGGVAYEAMNNAGADKTPLIVVLNDNHMSISSNVGGMAKHLQRLRTSSTYLKFKRRLKNSSERIPKTVIKLQKLRDRLKSFLLPGAVFEGLGFKYIGPIDGHDIPSMVQAFEAAKKWQRPVIVHVVTKKGKGFGPAELNPAKYHGTGPFDLKTADASDPVPGNSFSDVFGEELAQIMKEETDVVAVTAAMTDGTGLSPVKNAFPDRLFDEGIAEQHCVSFAAGLALGGRKPVVAIYSTFLQRAYDQIITEICLQQLPVVFAIDRAGVTGADGETHQGLFDISYLSSMPGMRILSPKDEEELAYMLRYALQTGHPCAIRYPRGKACSCGPCRDIQPVLLKEGKEAAILATGSMVQTALKAAEMIHPYTAVYEFKELRPLNISFLSSLFEKYPVIITLEDGTVQGGFGSQISRLASQRSRVRVLNLGWPHTFIEHGSREQLMKRYGLDAAGVAQRAEAYIEAKA